MVGYCSIEPAFFSPSLSPRGVVLAISAVSPLLAERAAGFFSDSLFEADPEVAAAIRGERDRQQSQIELVASENIVSRAVLEAQGSVLTNKYAEGYPGRRYYGRRENGDIPPRRATPRPQPPSRRRFAPVP